MLPYVHKPVGNTPRFDLKPTTAPNSPPPPHETKKKPNGRRGEEEERSKIKGEVQLRAEDHHFHKQIGPKNNTLVKRVQL